MGGAGRGMKLKRILALLGVLLLAGLVLLFFILALTGASKNTLMAVAFSILFFSVLFYAMAPDGKGVKAWRRSRSGRG